MAAPTAPAAFSVVRFKTTLLNAKHLWDVLPSNEKDHQNLLRRAPKLIEAYKRDGLGEKQRLDVLRCYVLLGHQGGIEDRAHPTTDETFWQPLRGLLLAGDKLVRQRVQCGSGSDPGALVCAYVVAAIPPTAGASAGPYEYALMFACGYDATTETYALVHEPNGADLAVLQEQQRRRGGGGLRMTS